MKKPDIVKYIKDKHPEMDLKSIKDVVDEIFEVMAEALAKGEKIEIRKIGSFRVLKRKKPLKGRKRVSYSKTVHFKPGKVLKRALKSVSLEGEKNAKSKK